MIPIPPFIDDGKLHKHKANLIVIVVVAVVGVSSFGKSSLITFVLLIMLIGFLIAEAWLVFNHPFVKMFLSNVVADVKEDMKEKQPKEHLEMIDPGLKEIRTKKDELVKSANKEELRKVDCKINKDTEDETMGKRIIFKPGGSKTHHVFGKDNISLCKDWEITFLFPGTSKPYKGNEKFVKGQDCKICFDKAKERA